MDEKIEITEKAVRKSAGQERAFVDMLNQEVQELQANLEVDELSNEICMGAIDYTTERDIKPHRNGVHGHIAERLIQKGYRKESDTAREILECLRFLVEERNCVGGYDLEDETIDGTIFVEILNELKERYGVDLGE